MNNIWATEKEDYVYGQELERWLRSTQARKELAEGENKLDKELRS